MSAARRLVDVPGHGAGAVCDYCQQRPVERPGLVCWPCQSYQEYLEGPFCECPHEPSEPCYCDDQCTEDCPAAWHGATGLYIGRLDDGDEASQPRVAPERSEGEG